MKKIIYVIPLLLLIIVGCSISINTNITENDLIGGTWIATAGYEDREPEGDPYCMRFVMDGLEFKEEGVFYSVYFGKNYQYYIEDSEKDITLILNRDGNHYSYFLDKIDDDAIGLIGRNQDPNLESCYLERQD